MGNLKTITYMKRTLLIIILASISVYLHAQTISTDGNTRYAQAPTNRIWIAQLADSFDTRILAKFSVNPDVSVATTTWVYQYKMVYDTSNIEWRSYGIGGSITTPISFMDLETAIFNKILDSTQIKNVTFLR